jgi:hypothetical protein
MGRTDEVAVCLAVNARMRQLDSRIKITAEAGWETRGNGLSGNYEGGIVHHTATPSSAARPFPTQTMLRTGRSDLPGPLCNYAGPYCTTGAPWIHLMAAFPANHAGASGGRSMGPLPVTTLFNPRVLGLEIDYAGLTPMSDGQLYVAKLWSRAVADVLGRSTEYTRAHMETSITGKWDPGYANGRTIDMAAFRRGAATITPGGDEDLDAEQARQLKYIYDHATIGTAGVKNHGKQFEALIAAGITPGKAGEWSASWGYKTLLAIAERQAAQQATIDSLVKLISEGNNDLTADQVGEVVEKAIMDAGAALRAAEEAASSWSNTARWG